MVALNKYLNDSGHTTNNAMFLDGKLHLSKETEAGAGINATNADYTYQVL